MLQTHPHGAVSTSGVSAIDALRYSGSHPVSRLVPLDRTLESAAPGLNATLFAFSALAPGDMEASARPGIAFVLSVANRGQSAGNGTCDDELQHALLEVFNSLQVLCLKFCRRLQTHGKWFESRFNQRWGLFIRFGYNVHTVYTCSRPISYYV